MRVALPRHQPQLIVAVAALTYLSTTVAAAQPLSDSTRIVALENVHVVPMDREGVLRSQTVLVEGDRIVAVGSSADVPIPATASRIDGGGRYLLPGLTDAHVHLDEGMPWARTRPHFGDAPLYLAYGVTTVVNLRGTPAHLEWRQQIATGKMLGPTIYTAGDFVNEPRVTSAEDVRGDILRQAAQGYDLIKFHELPRTTVGLSPDAYEAMIKTAREAGLPIVGHAPVNLGLDALLDARQPLAHVGMLSNIYFLPVVGSRTIVMATLLASLTLMTLLVAGAFVRRLRRQNGTARSVLVGRLRAFGWFALLGVVAATVCLFAVLPGSPSSVIRRLLISIRKHGMLGGSYRTPARRSPKSAGLRAE